MSSAAPLGPDYDVVIAGGGMVGASLALSLSVHSAGRLRILLIESFPLSGKPSAPVYTPSFDARSTALSMGSRRIFEALELWSTLAEHLAAIDSIHVSSRGAPGSTVMDRAEVGWPALGYVVENPWLGNALFAALAGHGNVTITAPATVKSIAPKQSRCVLTVQRDETLCDISAALVVVADGAQSGLRAQLGIEHCTTDYGQVAVIANVCFTRPLQGRAFERFTRRGPLALLPLADSERGEPRAALVWSLPPEEAARQLAAPESTFLASLQRAFGHRVGEFTRVGERASYPLQRVVAREQVRRRIVVMGNAAHALHPVAGQGFNLALRDCARLTEQVCDAARRGDDIGALPLLSGYQRRQAGDQDATTAFSDRLPALFGSRNGPLGLLRTLGLASLDITPSAKQAFIHHTAGMFPGAAGVRTP